MRRAHALHASQHQFQTKTYGGRVLQEGDGRHVDEVAARAEGGEEGADQAHVVVLREPRDHVGLREPTECLGLVRGRLAVSESASGPDLSIDGTRRQTTTQRARIHTSNARMVTQ